MTQLGFRHTLSVCSALNDLSLIITMHVLVVGGFFLKVGLVRQGSHLKDQAPALYSLYLSKFSIIFLVLLTIYVMILPLVE